MRKPCSSSLGPRNEHAAPLGLLPGARLYVCGVCLTNAIPQRGGGGAGDGFLAKRLSPCCSVPTTGPFPRAFFLCQIANRAGAGSSQRQRCNRKQAGSAPNTSPQFTESMCVSLQMVWGLFPHRTSRPLERGENQGRGREELGRGSQLGRSLHSRGDLYQPTLPGLTPRQQDQNL